LPGLPRIWLLLLVGILLLRPRIARVVALLLVGILRVGLGLRRRRLLAAGRHVRRRPRRRAADGLERIELRRRRRNTWSRKGRGNRTGGVDGSGHRARSILESWC